MVKVRKRTHVHTKIVHCYFLKKIIPLDLKGILKPDQKNVSSLKDNDLFLYSIMGKSRSGTEKVLYLRDRYGKPSPITLKYDKTRNNKRRYWNGGSGIEIATDLMNWGACSRVRRVLDTSSGIYYADLISVPKMQYGALFTPISNSVFENKSKSCKGFNKKYPIIHKIIDYSANKHFITFKTLQKIRKADERFINTPRLVFMEIKRKISKINGKKINVFYRRCHVLYDLGTHDLKEFVPDNLSHALLIASHLIESVLYLHQNKIIHRDIKPENIICFENSLPKLIDFNLSFDFNEINTPVASTAGTKLYIAPELRVSLDKKKLRTFDDLKKSDTWSLGATLFNLFTSTTENPKGEKLTNSGDNKYGQFHQGYYAVSVDEQKERTILESHIKKSSIQFSSIQLSLLRGLLEPNPELRLSLDKALNMFKR